MRLRFYMASGTSKETEIKLTNVARASLEELLEDSHPWSQPVFQLIGLAQNGLSVFLTNQSCLIPKNQTFFFSWEHAELFLSA